MITTEPKTATSIGWVPCQGWFSAGSHDQPAWIGIADGRIVEISQTAPQAGQVFLDDPALHAIPLLADTHVHVYMDPWPVAPSRRRSPGAKEFETEVNDALARVDHALRMGVGLLRDMGDPYGINLEVKRRLARRGTAAPELLVAGAGIHRRGKYGRFLGISCESAGEACALIDARHRDGEIDFVKVVTTGIVDFAERRVKQSPQFSAQELSRIVAHAHELGYSVASHCSGQEGIDVNLAAGVDFIEHAYFIREDQIDQMVQQRVAWTPTFAPVRVQGTSKECGWSDDVRRTIDSILHEHAARIAYAIERGANVLVGTDAGSPGVDMGGGIRIELERLATAGIPAEQLLHMATIQNAGALETAAYSPVLEVGAAASFALYERCPWDDIRHLDSLRHVFWRGEQIR